jgi:hypothetical protein
MVNRAAEDCRSIVGNGQHQPSHGAVAYIARDRGSIAGETGIGEDSLRAHVQRVATMQHSS